MSGVVALSPCSRSRRSRCALLLSLLAAFGLHEHRGLVGAAKQRGTLTLGGNSHSDRWRYVSKFGYAIGEGTYSMRLRLPADESISPTARRSWPPSVHLDVFLDEDWHRVEQLAPCARAREGPARRTLSLDLAEQQGEWGSRQVGMLFQVMRPHIWYFAISDCRGELGNTTVKIDYEFHAQQFDGSELSVEARRMPAAEGIALLGLTGLVVSGGRRCREFGRRAGGLHPVIWVLCCAVLLQYLSQLVHLVHLRRYQADGEGLWFLDAVAEVLFMAVQVIHATLLIAIAQGYTLLPEKENRLKAGNLVFVGMLAAHAALVCFSKLQEGASAHRHHDNDGVAGWVILFVRLLLFCWFIGAVKQTQERAGLRLQQFLQSFRLAGALYFLAYPTVFCAAQLFAPYLRHPVMQVGLLAAQSLADYWLAELFLSRGAYFTVSTLSSSLLPGCASGGCSPIGVNKGD